MPSLALISTWKEICGIAHYASFQEAELSRHFDVKVFPLPQAVFLEGDSNTITRRIEEVCAELPSFDAVHIHYEPGLFGRTQRDGIMRAAKFIEAAGNLSIEFHAVPRAMTPCSLADHYREARTTGRGPLRSAIRSQRLFRHERSESMAYSHLVTQFHQQISRHASQHRTLAIAHRQSDAALLESHLDGVEVMDYPLAYLPADFDANALAKHSQLHAVLPNVPPDVRFIGVFGFIAPYKGFDIALRALDHLPENYHLLMFTSIHRMGKPPSDHLDAVDALTRKHAGRVHQTGVVTDDDILVGMMLCDSILFPYRNGGTASSAPASMAIDMSRHIVCSRSDTFLDLAQYHSAHMRWADIDNPQQFAEQVLTAAPQRRDRRVHGFRFVDFPKKPRSFAVEDFARQYASRMLGHDE